MIEKSSMSFSDVMYLLNVKKNGPCFPKIASCGNSRHEKCPAIHSTFLKAISY